MCEHNWTYIGTTPRITGMQGNHPMRKYVQQFFCNKCMAQREVCESQESALYPATK
jgi:hypothetical protein